MTDRELLEMAAKAVGLTGYIYEWVDGPTFVIPGENPVYFNPLKDDGDALRLAVKLNIEFACFDDHQSVNAGVWSPNGNSWDCLTPYNGDKIAATRCAITRAAAQIGKSMKENI